MNSKALAIFYGAGRCKPVQAIEMVECRMHALGIKLKYQFVRYIDIIIPDNPPNDFVHLPICSTRFFAPACLSTDVTIVCICFSIFLAGH